MRFRYIPPGEFLMGSPESETGRDDDERQHPVTLTRGYWMGETEVTQGQWKKLMGDSPSYFAACGDDCPVETVSWYRAVAFVNALSAAESLPECYEIKGRDVTFAGLDCEGFRLPTEAEWERAARAETEMTWYFGNDGKNLDQHANVSGSTNPVRQKTPSPWGLYDVYGNVREWCHDRYGSYPNTARDPMGPETAPSRVLRGGSFSLNENYLRGADRYPYAAPGNESRNIGFRVAWSAAGGQTK